MAHPLGVSRRAVQETMRKHRAGVRLQDLKKRDQERKLSIRQEHKQA